MRFLPLLVLPALLLVAARPQHRPVAPGHPAPAALAAPGQVLSPARCQALLARTDLGQFWRHRPQAGTGDVLNGCYGYDGRRIEFIFTSVLADARQPGRYAVAGKFRCYGDVTPFRGSVVLTRVQRLPNGSQAYANGEETTAPVYCATGRFALKATNSNGLGGQFDGRVALDFQPASNHKATLLEYTTNANTRHGGLLFDGNWREDAAGEPIPVIIKQGMAVTHDVLTRFDMGDRSPSISPKYRRVGWDSYWANDEWWLNAPVAKR